MKSHPDRVQKLCSIDAHSFRAGGLVIVAYCKRIAQANRTYRRLALWVGPQAVGNHFQTLKRMSSADAELVNKWTPRILAHAADSYGGIAAPVLLAIVACPCGALSVLCNDYFYIDRP